MTPKEKAAELINKMYYTQSSPTHWVQAQQCALIAVDEIIKTYLEIDPKLTYWQEVKQELLKIK